MPEFTTESGLVIRGERSRPQKTLAEIVDIYDIVDVEDTHILVADRQKKLAEPDYREIGATGQTTYGAYPREEYNAALRGKEGTVVYDKMRRSSAKVRQSLRVIKTPVLGARWFVQPASNAARDRKIADFVTEAYTKRMSMSWFQMQVEQLLCIDFGWYAFEKVFKKEDGKIWWQKMAPRHPLDHYEWEWDHNGGPEAAWYYGPAAEAKEEDGYYPLTNVGKRIKIEKLLIFTHDKEAGDLEGISALRSAYPHWYIIQNLYKIDAIQKERHGIGIPVIKLPAGYSANDKSLANELGRNLRTNEKAHVVLPPNFILEFAKVEGQMVDSIKSVEHHNQMIMDNVMAGFLDTVGQSESKTGADMFQKGSRFIADVVRDVHNKWAIPELVRYNFGENADLPELKVRRLGDTVDWRTMSFAIRNLVGAKLMTPSTELEDWFRDEMDLPPMTPEDVEIAERLISQMGMPPQVADATSDKAGNSARADMPRQSNAQNQRQMPKGNAGQDGSGA